MSDAGGGSQRREEINAVQFRASISSPLEVMGLLNCQACYLPMYPPIFQCPEGHSTCSYCKEREGYCHNCSQFSKFTRCHPFEMLLEKLNLSCRYYDKGCPGIFPYTTKKDHESTCEFRPFNCPDPLSKCAFTGDVSSIIQHLKEIHKLKLIISSRVNVKCSLRLSLPYGFGTRDLDIYKCLDQHFCFHFEALKMPKDIVYIAFITFLGDDCNARDYRYRLEVNNGVRKMAWVGVPRSIRNGQKVIKDRGTGLVIHSSSVDLFCASTGDADNQELVVTGRIWKL